MDNRNVRPEDMERITTPALAKAFIEDQIGTKKFFLRFQAVWIHP